MAKWAVEFGVGARQDLAGLDRSLRRRILDRLQWFSENFDYISPLPLSNEWRGFFKLRVGDWRVVYTFNTERKAIIVQYIDRRDRIYKKRRK